MNSNSEIYARGNSYQTSIYNNLIDRVIPYLKPGDYILDIGCGDGKSTANLRAIASRYIGEGGVVIGLDILTTMVCHANENYVKVESDLQGTNLPALKFVEADIGGDINSIRLTLKAAIDSCDLTFDKRKDVIQFDRIVSSFCLHWVGDQILAWRNILELLEPSGSLHAILVHKLVGSLNAATESVLKVPSLSTKLGKLKDLNGRMMLPWKRSYMPPECTKEDLDKIAIDNMRNILLIAGWAQNPCHDLSIINLPQGEITYHESPQVMKIFISGFFPDVLGGFDDDERDFFYDHFIKRMMEYNYAKHGDSFTLSIPYCYICYKEKEPIISSESIGK